MKLVDTNVLLYVVDRQSPHHRVARHWLDAALSGGAPVGFAWLALVGFIRIATNPRLASTPLTTAQAAGVVAAWTMSRSARILQPGSRHTELLGELLDAVGAGGNLTHDAHLAALALEHKATVVTFDSDFGRFPGVTWERPH
jgi:uncharacterized protein